MDVMRVGCRTRSLDVFMLFQIERSISQIVHNDLRATEVNSASLQFVYTWRLPTSAAMFVEAEQGDGGPGGTKVV